MSETQFKDSAVSTDGGVEYLKRKEHGCRAILDGRDERWKLPLVCGKPQAFEAGGGRASYCQYHLMIYTNQRRT